MKSTVLVFICIVLCCQAAVINGGKDAVVNGVAESVPAVTIVTTETSKTDFPVNSHKDEEVSIGPVPPPTPKTTTTVSPSPTTTNSTTVSPTPTTSKTTTVTPSPTTTNATTVTPSPSPTTSTTVTPPPTTTNGTTTTPPPTKPTTAKPIPSSTTAPVTSTTIAPPSNRGFDGPSFIGGIVLASGLMAIGFVALKFYRARTELNYHTL